MDSEVDDVLMISARVISFYAHDSLERLQDNDSTNDDSPSPLQWGYIAQRMLLRDELLCLTLLLLIYTWMAIDILMKCSERER